MRPSFCQSARLRRRPRRRAHGRRAMTLVEVAIVVLVIGVLAAVATPVFVDSLQFHRVESAARRVKADLELARQAARRTSAPQSVSFSDRSYTVSGTTGLDNPQATYQVNLAAAPYDLQGVTADFGGMPTVTFDGYGTPDSGGAIELVSARHKCIVELDASTGQVTIVSDHARARTPESPSAIN